MNKKIAIAALVGLALGIVPFAVNAQTSTKPAATMTKSATKIATKPAEKMIAPVNVNNATAAQLETLPNVGPKIAADIIKNRPYKDGKELQAKVKGIGPKTWAKIEKYVLFK
jgi:competence protein ComEA